MKKLLFFFLLGNTAIAFGQFGPQQVISAETDKAFLSIPLDVDGDGITDVLSAQAENQAMVWFQNLDGLGTFGPKITLPTNGSIFTVFEFADWDGDGDNDFVFSTAVGISWLENLDGNGNFAPGQPVLTLAAGRADALNLLDYDQDGDLDLLLVIYLDFQDDEIAWFENTDGQGTFGPKNILATCEQDFFFPPLLVDVDDDGDKDLLLAEEGISNSRLVWLEYLGSAQLSGKQVIQNYAGFTNTGTLLFEDLNMDGKNDIVLTLATNSGRYHVWLENLGGASFGSYNYLTEVDNAASILAYDLDGDSDMDLLLRNLDADKISWMENANGQGTFQTERNIATEIDFPRDAGAADLNGDGYLDVLSASLGDDTVAWYPNNSLGIGTAKSAAFTISPNPTRGLLSIQGTAQVQEVTVTNLLGQQVATFAGREAIDLSLLLAGAYLMRVTSTEGESSTFRVIRE